MISIHLFASSDSDFDGVVDTRDLCPNTSFDKVVDHYGCPDRKDITLMIGQDVSSGSYGGTEEVDTSRTNYFASFSTTAWSYSLSTSSVSTKTSSSELSGSGDVYAVLAYKGFSSAKDFLTVQAGTKIATADTTIGTGENDYNIRLSKILLDDSLSYLYGLGYTLTGDTAVQTYNDFLDASIGIGYQIHQKLYLSASFSYASAYIEGTDESLSTTAYLAYNFNKQWFTTASYTVGLSDSVADQAMNISIGVSF